MNLIVLFLSMVLCWLVGFLAFHVAPLLEGPRKNWHTFADLHIWLSMFAINRAAILVQADGELLWKKLTYDEVGAERINVGEYGKLFDDPDNALTRWCGRPFALADEYHGVLFDPRHAAIGRLREEYKDRGEWFARASDDDWDRHDVNGWIRGVLPIDDVYELVTLEGVRHLATGSERAEHAEHAKTFYKLSRNPDGSKVSIMRLLLPFAVFMLTVIAFWQIGMRTGSQSGGGGSTVAYSVGMLALAVPTTVDRHVGKLAVGAIALVAVMLIAGLLGPLYAIVLTVCFALGFTFMPFLAIMAGLANVGGYISILLIWFGMLGYSRPVFKWTPEGYELVEYDDLDKDTDVQSWYSLAGTRVGFTFDPSEESFGPDVMDREKLEAKVGVPEARTDGSGDDDGPLPRDHHKAAWFRSGDASYAAFLPNSYDKATTYLHSAIAGRRIAEGTEGKTTDARVQEAKEKYGDGNYGLADKTLLYLTFGAMLFGTLFGWFVFL